MRNKSALKFAIFLLGICCLVFQTNCQHAQLAPYSKYATDAEVPRISLEEAKKDYDAGTAVFIDARGEFQYKQEHIAGSLGIADVGPVEQDYPNIPRGKKIIVYCS